MRIFLLVVVALTLVSPSLVADSAIAADRPPEPLFFANQGQGCSGEALSASDLMVTGSMPLTNERHKSGGEVSEGIATATARAGGCEEWCQEQADLCYASCVGLGLPDRVQCMRGCLSAYDACVAGC